MSYVFVFVSLIMILLCSLVLSSCYFHTETLPIPMYAHQGVFSAAMNAVYIFGGITGTTWDSRSNLNKVYKWDLSDPSSGFVEIGMTPNTGWFYSFGKNAVLVNDQVFFIGIDHNDWQSGKIFVYDLNTEAFITDQKTPMAHPSYYGCLTTNTTHIFMVDGDDDSTTQRLPIIQVYDIAADAWQSQVVEAGPLITGGGDGWRGQYCSLVGDALYVLGGIIVDDSYIDGIYRIDTHTLEIEPLNATLPSPQGYGVSIYDGDHNLYLFGSRPFKQDVVAVDLDTLSVSAAFQSQQFYASAPVLTINGSIYRFGGRRNESDSFYYALDEVEICDLPTDIPTQSPTQLPTSRPTAKPSGTPTDHSSSDLTDLSTAPSALPSNNDEYGVNITIKLDAVVSQNETDALVTALREYAQNIANTTNCSERINVSSEIEDDSKTVMKMSIVTCSESTEKQLLVAFDETVLEEDIIGGIVAEADVDAIEIEGTYADSPAQTVPADDVEKKRYWYLILLAVLLSAGVVVLWFVWRRIKKNHVTRKDLENLAVASPPQQAAPDRDHPVADDTNVDERAEEEDADVLHETQMVAVQTERQRRIASLLRPCGLAHFAVQFEAEGLDNASLWTPAFLSDAALKSMAMSSGDVVKFRQYCAERVEKEKRTAVISELLQPCGLAHFAVQFEAEGLSDASLWIRDYVSEATLKSIGMKAGEVAKFRKYCDERVRAQKQGGEADIELEEAPVPKHHAQFVFDPNMNKSHHTTKDGLGSESALGGPTPPNTSSTGNWHWYCALCSLKNENDRDRCEMCDAPKDGLTADGAHYTAKGDDEEKDTWQCTLCQFENGNQMERCKSCEAPKHGVTVNPAYYTAKGGEDGEGDNSCASLESILIAKGLKSVYQKLAQHKMTDEEEFMHLSEKEIEDLCGDKCLKLSLPEKLKFKGVLRSMWKRREQERYRQSIINDQ